jgi:hypothetical protein
MSGVGGEADMPRSLNRRGWPNGDIDGTFNLPMPQRPPRARPLIGDYPIFRDDKTTLPLRAADLAVGNSRRFAEAHDYGREPEPALWGNLELNIEVLGRYWTKEMMLELRIPWNF